MRWITCLAVHASVGIRMKELDTLNDSGDDLSIQYKQQLAELRDVDYAKAISSLTQQQDLSGSNPDGIYQGAGFVVV